MSELQQLILFVLLFWTTICVTSLVSSQDGEMARKYTPAEIDDMRASLRYLNRPQPMMPFNQADLDRSVEDQLRTHIAAGTDPADLAKHAGGKELRGR